MLKYRIARVEDDGPTRWSPGTGLYEARDKVIRRMRPHQGKGYRLRLAEPNEQPGPVRTLDELHKILDDRMKHMELGDMLIVRALKDDHRIAIRKVNVKPPLQIRDIGGNARIDRLNALIVREFQGKGLQNWGVCVRRYIAGTTTWSQHSPWPQDSCESNAIDYGGSMYLLDQVFRYTQRLKAQGEPVGTVLWRVSGHWNHLHLEAEPHRPGWPCSGCR